MLFSDSLYDFINRQTIKKVVLLPSGATEPRASTSRFHTAIVSEITSSAEKRITDDILLMYDIFDNVLGILNIQLPAKHRWVLVSSAVSHNWISYTHNDKNR
jgi:hypothetical protein